MTYKDILDQIQGSGQGWSQWDLDTAKAHPEFGASMLSYKSDWYNAKDQAGRQAANAAAENLRRQYGNYLGGSDGSKYYGLGASPGGYQSGYQSRISEILDRMGSYGDFSYGPAPAYNNRYQQQLDELLGKVQNYGPFSWSKEGDPSYSAYAKQYRREGQRAAQDAMAQAAAMTGGNVSSAAMTAASQAGDYYAGKLSDKIPELYENAYQRYLSQYQMLADQLSKTQGAEQMDYAKFLDQLGQYNADRSFGYNQWLDKYNMLGSTLGAYQGQDQTEYQRLLDQADFDRQNQSLYQQQVDAILSAGGTPSAALVGQSGYGQEYVNALKNYYQQQAVSRSVRSGGGGGSSGGSGGNAGGDGSGDGGNDYEGLFRAALESGYPESYISNHYKEYGFTSKTGLTREFEAWAQAGQGAEESGAGGLSVDMASVLALGYGPISADRLDQLVKAGQVEEYQEGDQIKFRKRRTSGNNQGGTLWTNLPDLT